MSHDGIDMRRSGWTNPDGFRPEPRPATPAPPAPEVCGNQGPDGWVCDLNPGHIPAGSHWADTGEAGGERWEDETLEALTLKEGETAPRVPKISLMDEVGTIARGGLANPSPAAWAVALNRIVERIYG